jgi:SAM-dependent methyltransferase
MIDRIVEASSCPLCNAVSCREVGVVSNTELAELYWLAFQIELADLPDELSLVQCDRCSLKYFSPLVPGTARFYDLVQARCTDYYATSRFEFAVARDIVSPSDRVIEVGAGTGLLAEWITCADYVGLDISPGAVDAATGRGVNVTNEPIETHARDHSASYDVAIAFQVLEHVANPRRFISLLGEVTGPGGRVLIAVPSDDSFMRMAKQNALNFPPHHVTRWPDATLAVIPELLHLELVTVLHEPLSRGHVAVAIDSWVASLLELGRSGLAAPHRLKPVVGNRSRWMLSRAAAYALSPVRNGFRGHTAVAVYRVPS